MANEKKEIEFKNVTLAYAEDPNAKTIVLPAGMTPKKGAEWLLIQDAELGKEVAIHYTFGGWYPLDAALALYKALMRTYGFTSLVPTPGFFGDKPPTLVGVEVEPGKTVQIPWGSMAISGVQGRLETGSTMVEGQATFVLAGKVVQRDRDQVDKIVALAKSILATESIYRGKAVRVDLPEENFDILKAPKFMDLEGVKETDLIFPYVVQEAVETNIFSVLKHTDLCREHGIPRRRGILLAGRYGTGKTLTARVTAKVARDNGWTFIYLDDLTQLPQAMRFAKQYQPAVIFGEDINRVVSGNRDANMDEYFNVIDGVDNKKDEVMVVFTTNDVDEIHPGMLRPGRVDAMIHVTPPDALATERLVRVYGRGLIDPLADLRSVGEILAGQIPAVTREAVERAKLVAIRDGSTAEGRVVVYERHLVSAARQLVAHSEYINRKYDAPKPDIALLGDAIGERIAAAITGQKRFEDNFGTPEEGDEYGTRLGEPKPKEALVELLSDSFDKAGRPSGNGRKEA